MRLMLAGSYVQAVKTIEDMKARNEPIDDIYVLSDPQQAMAVERDTEIILTGTYSCRPDWLRWRDLIAARFFKETYL